MLINSGRLLMTGVWLFLLWNVLNPFPKPLRYFLDIVLFFMIIMHGLQLRMINIAPFRSETPLKWQDKLRVFLFGVFELLAWRKNASLKRKK